MDKVKKISRGVYKFFNRHTDGLINKRIVNITNTTNESLAVLRERLHADRAFIYEFHNGERFLSNRSRIKITKTYEKTGHGISYEKDNFHNLEVSLFWDDWIKIFFEKDGDKLPDGISVYNDTECKFPRRVYIFDINKMNINGGPTKTILEKQNIYHTFQTPILDFEDNIIGILGIDYSKDGMESIDTDEAHHIYEMCKYASEIAVSWALELKKEKR